MSFLYLTHSECALHEMGAGHPERPSRMRAIEERLNSDGILSKATRIEIQEAKDADLLRAHTREQVHGVREASPKEGRAILDPDTTMNPHSLRAGLLAAGSGILAVDKILSHNAKTAFCNVRPPGHHAESHRAMGFCLFNNVAVAAKYALDVKKLNRVLIVDFDVHHGNGTEDIFKDDDRVMLCSSFQHPFYPYSPLTQIGANPHVLKSPMDAGANGDDLKKAVEGFWGPRWENFKPELVFISAGFDAHEDDPLGGLKWKESDYAWMTSQIVNVAKKYSESRIVSCLEGGYDLNALASSAAAHVCELISI